VTLVREQAARLGDRPAIRFADETLTYASLDARSDRVAGGLRAAGVRPGDRVACLLFNGSPFVDLWFGVAKAGALLVPLNTALKGSILRYELDDSAPRGLVVDERLWGPYREVRAEMGRPVEWIVPAAIDAAGVPEGARPFDELRAAAPLDEAPAPRPQDPASVLYTSGTTGPPKGAVIPHQQLLLTAAEIGARSRLEPGSVLFSALPLFHCNAQEMTALTALLGGHTAAFDERFHATTYWETAARFGATHVSLLISMINVLYKQPDRPTDRTHGVRVALTAGATREVWPRFEARFRVSILELYGMTECGCTTLMNPPDAVRVGSVGTPLGFVEAQVVDDDDRPVPPGTRGELLVRPRTPFAMFLGYLNKAEKTVEAERNLWFHTGDYVTRDADGYYYFVERKKDVIRRRGENIAPYDVETALNRHPAVFESVVVGVPSPLGEDDVKAFVQLKPGASADPAEMFAFLARELPFFMVPRYLEFLDEIPKTANQKAQRYLLRGQRSPKEHDREALGPNPAGVR